MNRQQSKNLAIQESLASNFFIACSCGREIEKVEGSQCVQCIKWLADYEEMYYRDIDAEMQEHFTDYEDDYLFEDMYSDEVYFDNDYW